VEIGKGLSRGDHFNDGDQQVNGSIQTKEQLTRSNQTEGTVKQTTSSDVEIGKGLSRGDHFNDGDKQVSGSIQTKEQSTRSNQTEGTVKLTTSSDVEIGKGLSRGDHFNDGDKQLSGSIQIKELPTRSNQANDTVKQTMTSDIEIGKGLSPGDHLSDGDGSRDDTEYYQTGSENKQDSMYDQSSDGNEVSSESDDVDVIDKQQTGMELTKNEGKYVAGSDQLAGTGQGGGAGINSTSNSFILYFSVVVATVATLYIIYHNRQKLKALILEGRQKMDRRKTNRGTYSKLSNKADDVLPAAAYAKAVKSYVY
jgi:hypothetical protein